MNFRVYGAHWDGGKYRCSWVGSRVTCKHKDTRYRATVTFRVQS